MDAGAWATIGVFIAGGFAAWMFRIDRGQVRIEGKVDTMATSLASHVTDDREKHEELFDHRNEHAERLTKLETRNELQDLRRHGGGHDRSPATA